MAATISAARVAAMLGVVPVIVGGGGGGTIIESIDEVET
jgi:hypothetical protein